MINFIKTYFSPENRIGRIEKRLHKANVTNNHSVIISMFSKGFIYLLKVRRHDMLSSFIESHLLKIKEVSSLKKSIPIKDIKQAIRVLESTKHDTAALSICDYFGHKDQAIEILAMRGRANDLSMRISKERNLDKGILGTVITNWEKYNGDITKSPTMTETVRNIGKFSSECLPDNPRVKEIIGQKKEAALLYEKEKDFANAARCYEEIGMYSQACTLYAGIKDNEAVSRTAEALGDLEKALEFVLKPERKIKLLIRLERFVEAHKYASGLDSPDEYFALIREKAKIRMIVKVKSHNFIEALELADVAECDISEKENILVLGRKYFDQKIISAANDSEIKEIYKHRVKLEEKAGRFDEAGRIAEEILKDLKLASLLYEKANLFNRAIHATSEVLEKQKDQPNAKIRLAELHEKGGNLLSAAQLYEQGGAFDKAFILYEKLQNYQKAIECYCKMPNPDKYVLAELYIKAEEYEKVIAIYLQSDNFTYLEKALSIAKKYNLTTHLKVINEKISRYLSGSEDDLKKYFESMRTEILSSYSPVLGIDFGTTNSVGAIFNRKTKKIEIIIVPGTANREFEPSFFGVDKNNHPIFGEKARLRALTAPECVVARIKRILGEGRSLVVGNKKYKSEEIVAKIIQKIKLNAEKYVRDKIEAKFRELLITENMRFPEDKISEFLNKQNDYFQFQDVVLTVPAYFNDNQKRATRDSAEIAGLRVLRLLHEPTAAALAYGYHKSYSGKLAVVDLGGGTLDISFLDVGEGIYDIQNISGDVKLGGSDIDSELLKYVISDINKTLKVNLTEKDYPIEVSRLRDSCENMKIALSTLDTYTMELRSFLNKPQYTFTLTRKELEKIARPVLQRVKNTIDNAIKEYGSTVDHILLVGNATKMPAVVEIVKSIRARHLLNIDPGSVVASGAALNGAILLGDLKENLLFDVVPYSLGISVQKKDTKNDELEMSLLIDRNTTIPTSKSQIYTTTRDYQTVVNIRIYQGESYEPEKNYFLGNFHLEGILPAPAGTPQIEVRFDIEADCILTVTAIDMATNKQQSIRIEGAVTLSPKEKAGLRKYFAESETLIPLEKKIEEIKINIDGQFETFGKTVQSIEQNIKDFTELFHEKVELNARFYNATTEQTKIIQNMFSQKDQLSYTLQKYKDEASSTSKNLQQILSRHIDYSERDIVAKLQELFNILSKLKEAIVRLNDASEKNILHIILAWIQILKAMDPDIEQMSPVKVANYHFVAGRFAKAREIIESMANDPDGLSEEAFRILLKCITRLCLRDEYRNTHKKYGSIFKFIYPDFNRLDYFLKSVDDSVYIIQVTSQQGTFTGSGFSISPNLIATNRHVVEGATAQNIRIIGKNKMFAVCGVEVDPINDLAILKVDETLVPFRLGEFNFVAPGEQVLALGFPAPTSNLHSENIYISKGIVNSIRNTSFSSERVIFIDAKIGRGMSGGPLINDLGEVIGIITLTTYELEESDKGTLTIGNQPIALPIHLVKNYLIK